MWNPSEKQAKQAFEYGSKSQLNYSKMNEMGKRAFWQYGRDKGIFNLNTLGVNAKGEYSKYVTDDMPYASKNPMERATLARQSEQGQFDDSDQVKASKLQDRRLLNESRLEGLTPTNTTIQKPYKAPLPQNIRAKGKAVAQQGKVAPKGLERPDNPFAPVLVPFGNQLMFGALERNTDAIEQLSAKHPVASTIGNIAGYGAKFALLGGANSALSTPLTKGIANPIVKRIAGEAITGMGIDAIDEAVKGKNDLKTAGKNIAMGAVYGIISDTALEGAGRLIKALGKKYGKNMPEQVVQTIAKMQEIEVKPEKTNAEVEDYYAMIEYLDEVNRKSPDYIKAEARMNVPNTEPIKPILDLPKTPVEAPKVSGGINTLPIQNKSLTGAIKASDETLEGTLPKATKTDTLQIRLYDDLERNAQGDLRGIAPESTNRVNAQIELANQKEPTTLITFDVDENLSKTDTPQGRIYGDTPKGDIPEGMKERGFSRNIRTDEAMPDDIRVNFDDSPLSYNRVGNSETLTKAEKIMEGGQAQAMSQYYDLLSKNKPESVPLAKLIAKNAEAAGDIDTARRVLADAAEKLTEAGQFSQAAKILRESDPETFLMTVDKQLRKLNEQGLKQYGKKWADIDLLPDEITAIQNIPRGNQQAYEEVWEQIANRISKDLPSTKMEKFDAWRRMAMLLNPKTHIRNTVGNVFMVGMRKTSDTLGAGLEKLFRVKDRTKSFGWSRNKELASKVDDIWNSVKGNVLGESRWEIDNIKSLGREKNIFKNKTLQGLNEFSLKTLNAEDNIFTQKAFKDALGQFMQANKLAEPTDAALAYAKRRALESTYKQANKLATWINQAKQIPVAGKFVEAAIPFTKTPANIMKTTFEYSPAGLMKLIFSKGKPPAEVIETLAKGLTGTSITGLGFMLASMGAAKTQNSKSNKVTAIDTEMGEQPYSIITPQGSYTFDWAQPLAVPLAMGIAMYESIKNKDELDFEAVMDSIAQGGDSLFNMSVLQNVKQFLGYGSTTENILGLPWEYVQQAWPSLFGQVAKTIDTTRRSTYDPNPQKQTWNRLKSRIPFASKSLEPSLNVWGEEQKQGGIIQQFINPGYAMEKSNDPVTIEISRLYAEHGDNDMLPKMAQNFKIEGKTTKLSPGDMTEFQRKMGQENHTEINRLISSAQYQLLSDKEKMKKIKKIVNDNYEEAKEGIIKKMK